MGYVENFEKKNPMTKYIKRIKKYEHDHIKEQSKGGSHKADNIRLVTLDQHKAKHGKKSSVFLGY